MRLLGYPAEKISILSTYNGQVALLNDVAKYRCSGACVLGWWWGWVWLWGAAAILCFSRYMWVGWRRDEQELASKVSLSASSCERSFAEPISYCASLAAYARPGSLYIYIYIHVFGYVYAYKNI